MIFHKYSPREAVIARLALFASRGNPVKNLIFSGLPRASLSLRARGNRNDGLTG